MDTAAFHKVVVAFEHVDKRWVVLEHTGNGLLQYPTSEDAGNKHDQ